MKQGKKWFFTISPCHIFQHRLCSHKALPWEEKIKFFESKHLGTRSLKGKPRCHCLFASFVCSFVTYYAISWDLEEMFKQSVSCDFLIEFKHSMPDWVCCELKCITVFIWLLLHQKTLHNCWRGKKKKIQEKVEWWIRERCRVKVYEKEIEEILPSNQLYDHCRETYKYCKCITYVKMCFEIGGFQTINNVLSFGKDL